MIEVCNFCGAIFDQENGHECAGNSVRSKVKISTADFSRDPGISEKTIGPEIENPKSELTAGLCLDIDSEDFPSIWKKLFGVLNTGVQPARSAAMKEITLTPSEPGTDFARTALEQTLKAYLTCYEEVKQDFEEAMATFQRDIASLQTALAKI